MMVVFEVYLSAGADAARLLSDEALASTQAQIMTRDEATAVGFQGLPAPAGDNVRYIAVARRDAPWIQRTLEGDNRVMKYRVHEVDA
jgi:hypothetical protein